nr:ATP-binding protein [Aliikangiella sp. G2MR2-5]
MLSLIYWNLSTGFRNYILQEEMEKALPILEKLESTYKNHGNWEFLKHNSRQWRKIVSSSLPTDEQQLTLAEPRPSFRPERPDGRRNARRQPPPGAERPPGNEPPPRAERHTRTEPPQPPNQLTPFVMRLTVLDADNQLVFGRPLRDSKKLEKTITSDGKKVGTLVLTPDINFMDDRAIEFLSKQTRDLGLAAMLVIFLSFLIALPFARHLVLPIQRINRVTHLLASGNYETKIQRYSNDEIGGLARDVNRLAVTLKKNEISRQKWIADISHELRTPLAILQGELDALIDGIRKVTPETLNSLKQELNRLNALVQDLHELSLSDMGALSYNKENLDLTELIREFFESHEGHINASQIQLSLNIPDSGATLFADGNRLDQLAKNLLQNTLRYTDKPGELKVSVEKNTYGINLIWEDSSPGVPPADYPYLFERLYRVEKSRNRAKGGAGLGMAICKNIVEAHEGDISLFQSSLGGLGIKIYFPSV